MTRDLRHAITLAGLTVVAVLVMITVKHLWGGGP